MARSSSTVEEETFYTKSWSHLLVPVKERERENAYRIAVRRVEEEFWVYVDNNYVRKFSTQTLPASIRGPIAMLHAFTWDFSDDDRPVWFQWQDKFPAEARDIGWRPDPKSYCLVISGDVLAELTAASVANATVEQTP